MAAAARGGNAGAVELARDCVQSHPARVQLADQLVQLRVALGQPGPPPCPAGARAPLLPARQPAQQRGCKRPAALAGVKPEVQRQQVRIGLPQPLQQRRKLAQIACNQIEALGAEQLGLAGTDQLERSCERLRALPGPAGAQQRNNIEPVGLAQGGRGLARVPI